MMLMGVKRGTETLSSYKTARFRDRENLDSLETMLEGCLVAIKTLAPCRTRIRTFCFPGSDATYKMKNMISTKAVGLTCSMLL